MTKKMKTDQFTRLVTTMALLRSDAGCDWDRKQTPDSLKPYILEECHELLEAIDRNKSDEIMDELGDLLLQVVFVAQIFCEKRQFTIEDVAASITDKLVRRHPHIFAAEERAGHEQRWEKIKLEERQKRGQSSALKERIPRNLPALKVTQKIAKHINPEQDPQSIWGIYDRLMPELISATEQGKRKETEDVLGEILFKIALFAGQLGIDAEDILRQKNLREVNKIDANNH